MIKIYSDGAATMKCVNGEYKRENGGWAWAAIDDEDNLIISNSGGLTGDIAKLNTNFKYLGLNNDKTSRFNWSSRDSGSVIFGNGGSPILISNLDNMLINMAQCRNGITSSSALWEKNISYQGNRTSASDSAVEKLQGYGYKININRV